MAPPTAVDTTQSAQPPVYTVQAISYACVDKKGQSDSCAEKVLAFSTHLQLLGYSGYVCEDPGMPGRLATKKKDIADLRYHVKCKAGEDKGATVVSTDTDPVSHAAKDALFQGVATGLGFEVQKSNATAVYASMSVPSLDHTPMAATNLAMDTMITSAANSGGSPNQGLMVEVTVDHMRELPFDRGYEETTSTWATYASVTTNE